MRLFHAVVFTSQRKSSYEVWKAVRQNRHVIEVSVVTACLTDWVTDSTLESPSSAPRVTEPESTLPCLQEVATCPCPIFTKHFLYSPCLCTRIRKQSLVFVKCLWPIGIWFATLLWVLLHRLKTTSLLIYFQVNNMVSSELFINCTLLVRWLSWDVYMRGFYSIG